MSTQATLASKPKTVQTWEMDVAHSSATFSIKHLMIASVRGRIPIARGLVEFDPEDLPATKLEAELDMSGIDTGVKQRDDHLRSSDFFDAETHPTMRFVGTGGEVLSENQARIEGDLTIRGVTRPVALDVEFEGEARDPWGRRKASFHATATLDRTEWGLTWNQALEAGGWLVGDKVKVDLNVQFVEREPAARPS